MKKEFLQKFHNLGGFAPFKWANRRRPVVLTYHRFSEEKISFHTSVDEFTAHLHYLRKNCTVLPLKTIIDLIDRGEYIPANSVAITIDDGYLDAYELAFPVLWDFAYSATVFAITDFVDGKIWLWTDKMRYVIGETKMNELRISFGDYGTIEMKLGGEVYKDADNLNSLLKKLPDDEKEQKIEEIAKLLDVAIPEIPPAEFAAFNWEQAREMDESAVFIESHTVTHPILTKIDDHRLKLELSESKKVIEKELDKNAEIFCYPNGSLDERVRNAVENAGYKNAVTTDFGFVDPRGDSFLMHRMDAQNDVLDLAQSVSGFESFKRKLRK